MPGPFTSSPMLGAFSQSFTAAGGTAIAGLIPPYPGPVGTPPYAYNAANLYTPSVSAAPVATKANWLKAPFFGVIRVTTLAINAGATVPHTVLIQRPLNWTYFPSGLAKNTTAIPNGSGSGSTGLFDDPGVYSTNYKYPTAGALFPGQVADAAISSTNLYVAYQLADGTWQLDTIASGTFNSTLTLTTGTPNRNGGAILAGAPLFYFGAVPGTLLDPANGQVAASYLTHTASVVNTFQDNIAGLYTALHAGDPMLVYDANGTNADVIEVAGYYGQF